MLSMAGKKVLIVEDDPITRQVLQAAIAAAGYEVVVAVDANAALMEVQKKKPDIVMLDIGLPAGGGFTFLQRLKLFPALSSIPIVVVSGKERATTEPRAREAGTAAYLEKPVKPEEVLATIERFVGKP